MKEKLCLERGTTFEKLDLTNELDIREAPFLTPVYYTLLVKLLKERKMIKF